MLLDLRNTNALLFRNSGTGAFNMVYRRGDGTIGWVEPQRDGLARLPAFLYPRKQRASDSGAPDERSFRHIVRRRGRRRAGRGQQEGPVPAARRRRRAAHRLAAKAIVACLNAREKIGSTGFGGGTAIPHGKIEGLPARVRLFRAAGDAGRFPGGRRPAGRSRLPAAVAARCGRRPSEGARHGQPRVPRPRRSSPSCAARGRRTRCYALLAGVEARDAA